MTRQEARERYGLTTTVYRQGFKAFVSVGKIKLVVRCPKTFISCESEWLDHSDAPDVFDMLVRQTVLARMSIQPQAPPPRFHQPFDF